MICERWNPLVNLFTLALFYHYFFFLSSIYHLFLGIILFYFFPKHFLFSGAYRYMRPLVADVAVVAKCHLSALYKHEKGKLFAQLVDLLQFNEKFEINDHVGTQLTDDEVLQSHYDRFQSFQLLAFKKIPKVHVSAGIYKCSELKNVAAYDVNIKEQLFVIINNHYCYHHYCSDYCLIQFDKCLNFLSIGACSCENLHWLTLVQLTSGLISLRSCPSFLLWI